MTDKEMLAMQGTEFIYEFDCGDTMPAYIKKIDPSKGMMSCWSFSFITEGGHEFTPSSADEEKEGAVCVLTSKNRKDLINKLTIIRDTGQWIQKPKPAWLDLDFFTGCQF